MTPKFRLFAKANTKTVDGLGYDKDMMHNQVSNIDFYNREVTVWGCGKEDCGMCDDTYRLEDVALMQSTGLTDVNGKEVYENDVVNIHWFYRGDGGECEAELNNVVIYHDSVDEFNAPYFFVMDKDEVVPLLAILMHEESIEVIGNIHQHPELLGEPT